MDEGSFESRPIRVADNDRRRKSFGAVFPWIGSSEIQLFHRVHCPILWQIETAFRSVVSPTGRSRAKIVNCREIDLKSRCSERPFKVQKWNYCLSLSSSRCPCLLDRVDPVYRLRFAPLRTGINRRRFH